MFALPLRPGIAAAALAVCLCTLTATIEAQPDFGDNSSRWADDGECDDPRFEGDGAAATLLEEDLGHDAADCRTLFDAGRIALRRPLAGVRSEHGRLEKGDETLKTGEFVDGYEFEGASGQHVSIDLRSSAFDTYLILIDPTGEQTENDDSEDDGDVGHSRIAADFTKTGTHRVLVTSYESGETGEYSLSIDPSGVDERDTPVTREAAALILGAPTTGELDSSDATFEAGEHYETYVFDGVRGDSVRLELSSAHFDTYLGLITPSGEELGNDDFEGDTARSVIALTLPESGRYRVQATSYAANETGRYRLVLTAGIADARIERRSRGRVHGLFAGISDYEPPNTDLEYTADDALRIRDALISGGGMRAEDAHTLLDDQATIANVAAAIRAVARRMGPDDTFVMFYSGHGDQVQRGGPTASDPDALDETLTLYDGDLRDDDLRALFDEIDEGTVLLLLDSCYSGGFAKDVVSAPGRMGIFSSEEDITSNVASKFRAGGYLSQFLDEAIAQGLADVDHDGMITAIELSHYLHERYRSDVKGAHTSELVRSEMTLGYQHLVVDRGSIEPHDVLFER